MLDYKRPKVRIIEPDLTHRRRSPAISSETVLDYFHNQVRLAVETNDAIPEEKKLEVFRVALKDEKGMIAGIGVAAIVEGAVRSIMVCKKPEDTQLQLNFQEKSKPMVLNHAKKAGDNAEESLRGQIVLIADALKENQGKVDGNVRKMMSFFSRRASGNLIKAVESASPKIKPLMTLMAHIVEIYENKTTAQKNSPETAKWSIKKKELLEAIKNLDISDPVARKQLKIIVADSPFKKVRDAASRALFGQKHDS